MQRPRGQPSVTHTRVPKKSRLISPRKEHRRKSRVETWSLAGDPATAPKCPFFSGLLERSDLGLPALCAWTQTSRPPGVCASRARPSPGPHPHRSAPGTLCRACGRRRPCSGPAHVRQQMKRVRAAGSGRQDSLRLSGRGRRADGVIRSHLPVHTLRHAFCMSLVVSISWRSKSPGARCFLFM